MFPAKYKSILFGLLLSGFMSFIVSGISTYKAVGLASEFISLWASSWFPSWLVAFPVVLIAAPLVNKLVSKMVRQA